MLQIVLADLSTRLLSVFPSPVRLVVHGGAVLLLHPSLKSKRSTTRDIDFICRSFVQEWSSAGFLDPEARLYGCIGATARQFGLGLDWMNAQADVALPMATDPQTGRVYDPIYTSAITPNNLALNIVYNSPGLILVAAPWYWAVGLKLVRYAKHDPADIQAMLMHGTRLSGVRWEEAILEGWLRIECAAMGYERFSEEQKREMRERIKHAIAMVQLWRGLFSFDIVWSSTAPYGAKFEGSLGPQRPLYFFLASLSQYVY